MKSIQITLYVTDEFDGADEEAVWDSFDRALSEWVPDYIVGYEIGGVEEPEDE